MGFSPGTLMPYLFISICSLNTAFYLLLHVIIHKHHFIDIYWSSTMCWWVFLAIKQSSLKKTLKTKHLVLSVHTYIVGRMCVRLSFQLCPALYDPMDCSPPDSSVHGILQARILENGVGCHFPLQGIFLTQGLNLCLLLGRWFLYHWATREAP